MKLCSLHWAFLILEVLGNSCQPPKVSEPLFWKKRKVLNNCYWIVNLEVLVIALLYMSLLSMLHLRSCQFVSPVFTLETSLRLLPEGPWHVPKQPSVLWQDKVPFLMLTAEFRQNPEQHVLPWCYLLFTLLKPGLTTYSCEALPDSCQECLKDALGNSMCRITEKSISLQSSQDVF